MITCRECGVEFPIPPGRGQHLRKYCDEHFKGNTSGVSKRIGRPCQECGGAIGRTKNNKAKYCTDECRLKSNNRDINERKDAKANAIQKATGQVMSNGVGASRRGPVYDNIMLNENRKLKDDLLTEKITLRVAAQRLGTTEASVSRARLAIRTDMEFGKLTENWVPSSRVRAMLPQHLMQEVKGMDTEDPLFDTYVDELVRAYSVFSRRYFNLEGKRPLIKDFHTRWIRSIIVAYATGGKQLILSPPRHGKSEMLIRFVVWFIVMDPNIRIGWFCASTDVAKLMLGAVKDILENNEVLIRDTLAPGQLYDPGIKSGRPWSAKEIKVAQQTHVGAKSSSMLALGRTSKFLSRDMDVLIVDDMEDYDSTREEGQRNYSRNKLAEIGTRKVEETCEVYIGSRQHPDDIPNLILQLEDTILQWSSIVDSAHDEECGEDPEDYGAHWDCMLFPEVRSYRYLMEKKLEMETLGLAHLYPLRYLNRPVAAEGQVFDMDLIREHALDRERGIGTDGLGIGRLVAGLDPSARGIQASFLWHYAGGKMSMVDVNTEQSGGQDGAVRIMREWYHEYGLDHWFYETNSQQIDFYNHVRKEVHTKQCHICQEPHPNITIKDHNTGSNKKDPELGISSMAPRYHDGRISLPFGTTEARKKVNELLRQLELWTTDGISTRVSKHKKTDVKMASWFPFPYFVNLEKNESQATLQIAADSSYQNYGNYTQAPWQQTQYPGG